MPRRPSPFGRCRIDDAEAAGTHLTDLERALRDAAVVEAEDAVDAAEAVGRHQPVDRKARPRFPVAGDADGQQHRIIAEAGEPIRSEEHTSELQSLMRISYAVFCLKKKKTKTKNK